MSATEITYAFRDATLKYSLDTLERKAEVIGYVNCPDHLDLPDKIDYNGDSYDVTSIGDAAFKKCTTITFVALPNNLLTIGDSAFRGCSYLKWISIPYYNSSLGACAFADCSSLESVCIGGSLESLYTNTFANCPKLKYISITRNVPPKVLGTSEYGRIRNDYLLKVPKAYREFYANADWWKNLHFKEDYDEDQGTEGAANQDVKVRGKEGVVYVEGAPPHSLIQIYDANGRPIATTITQGSNKSVQLLRNGVHYVRINNTTYSVAL